MDIDNINPQIGVPGVGDPPIVNGMETALTWIGFDNAATRNRIQVEGFAEFSDLMTMNEKDVRDLAESYCRHTAADGCFIFGVCRIKYLISMINWVQDFARVNENPSLDEFAGDGPSYCAALETALRRADVRKIEKDQSDTVSKAADPGKFKDEKKWPEWESAFVNYLSTIPGINCILLSYVVCEEEVVPTVGATYGSFDKRAIACEPLSGDVFRVDARISPSTEWEGGHECSAPALQR